MNTTTHNQQLGAALLRITFGGLLLSHGLIKLISFTLPGTVAYFESQGFPPIAAYLTVFGEIAGGLGILLGVLTRTASLLSLPILLGATYVHSANGFLFSGTGGGWEFPAMLVLLAITITIQGGGAYQLGNLLPRFARTNPLQTA